MNLAVFASGQGTILGALLRAQLPITLVLADQPCPAIDIAARYHQVRSRILPRPPKEKFDRRAYTREILSVLLQHDIGLVAMAGFMTFLDEAIFAEYENRILNTHPSLLPSFKGAHAVRDALACGVKITGLTIHVATPLLDSGRILDQHAVLVFPGDTEESLWERIKQEERRLYPQVIREYMEELAN